jgi:hypothetical protein
VVVWAHAAAVATPIQPDAHEGRAVSGGLDSDADRIAAGAGHVDLLGGVVPRDARTRRDDRACELRQVEHVLGRDRHRLAGRGDLAGDVDLCADQDLIALPRQRRAGQGLRPPMRSHGRPRVAGRVQRLVVQVLMPSSA